MNRTQLVQLFGRPFFNGLTRVAAQFRVYGRDRIPLNGPLVLCFNHFSWADPWAIGSQVPRTLYYVAKQEAHATPFIGQLIRAFGTISVRRGESDREAVRLMREIVHRGDALGMFPEGTRQEREPGPVLPGAAMIAVQEGAPVVCGAIHGSQFWKPGNFHPISVAFGEPMDVTTHPKNSKGYRAAALDIQHELRRLWEFLVLTHEQGRPRVAIPPR
ncbi:MAG: 1-acyl-sn-glycerol-3-phosphate acyltransferase [Gaiellaceae bacterium]|jgi:1-acyl-sn-glycerol-3-phosphate acyltransferase|nr:1-acyl-sn-glycerol-3-phosphate acyltransferase [Gaiellaceae bacterium]